MTSRIIRLPLAIADRSGDQNAKNVLIVCDAFEGPVHIHLIKPFDRQRRMRLCRLHVLEERAVEQADPETFAKLFAEHLKEFAPDVIFLSRVGGAHAKTIVDCAKQAKTPYVAHYDENLFADADAPEREERLRHVARAAKRIYVNTPGLAKQLNKLDLGPRIVASDIPAGGDLMEFKPPWLSELRKTPGWFTMGYMAGPDHQADLDMIAGPVAEVMDQHDFARFELFSELKLPETLDRFGPRVRRRHPVKPYPLFLDHMKSLDWDLGLAPLCDSAANREKTPSKWLEYTAAAIPTLASDIAPYQPIAKDGGAVLAPADGWTAAIEQCVADQDQLRKMVERARRMVAVRYNLLNVERRIATMLTQVDKKRFPRIQTRTVEDGEERSALIVLGGPRCGSSMAARIAGILGMGESANLMLPRRGNPDGSWESFQIVETHQRYLHSLGADWDQMWPLPDEEWPSAKSVLLRDKLIWILQTEFDLSKPFVVKDSRICRLLPIWREALDRLSVDAGFLTVFRDPSDIARSLSARDGFTAAKSQLIWLSYMLGAERNTRDARRSFVNYPTLRRHWRKTLPRIAKDLKMQWPHSVEEKEPQLGAFIRPEADEPKPPVTGIDGQVKGWATDLYKALKKAETGSDEELRKVSDQISKEICASERSLMKHFAGPEDLADRVRSFSALAMLRRAVAAD